jgi:hypothetical protein
MKKDPEYCEVVVGIGGIRGEHLQPDPQKTRSEGTTSNLWPLEKALSRLVDGGYVIDLMPLEANPQLASWVWSSPLSNGHVEGTDISRLPESVRESARQFFQMQFLEGAFHQLAALASQPQPSGEEPAGPFDYVSSAYLALYWHSRGARVGKRVADSIHWMDGTKQQLT